MHTAMLSQEHATLPMAELRAVLESCYPRKNVSLEILGHNVKIGLDDVSLLKNRLAYTMEIDEKELNQGFDARYPKKRPFTHPTTLDPKLARCMVNLARPPTPNLQPPTHVFDPFCGTGGILIEAGLMGFKAVGIDIDKNMVDGCIKNLEHYKVQNFDISEGDFFTTRTRGIIVTDPPYGKSTSLPGKNIGEFYTALLERLHSIVQKGALSVIGSPTTINTGEIARNIGFAVKEEHIFYVNQDMSKRVIVLEK